MSVLRSYFERWQRLEDERKTLAEDLKELFAEAKGSGYAPKAMRIAFRSIVAAENERPADRETADQVELYVADITGSRAHPAPAHTREAVSPKLVATIASGMQTEIGRKALVVALDVMIDAEEGNPDHDPETGEIHDADCGQHVRREDGEQCDEARVPRADGKREGDNEGPEGQGRGVADLDRSGRAVPRIIDREDEDGRSRHVGGETRHEITESDGGAIVAVKAQGRLASAVGAEPSPSENIPSKKIEPKPASFYRPNCLHPEMCGASELKHCHSCEMALANRESAA